MRSLGQALRSGALLLIAGFMLAGCGVGRAMVINPPDAKLRVSSVQASEGNSPVPVPADVKNAFTDKLNQHLYGEGGFQRGQS